MDIESQLRKVQEEFNLLDLRLEYEKSQLNLNSSQHFVAMLSNRWKPFFLKNDHNVILCKSSIELNNKKYEVYISRLFSERGIEKYTLTCPVVMGYETIYDILDEDEYLYDLLNRNRNIHQEIKNRLMDILKEFYSEAK